MAKRKQVAEKQTPTLELSTNTAEETRGCGEKLGRILKPGDVVALNGELGSGKTTLIQGIARGLGLGEDVVKSPTFVLQREYVGSIPLIHLDGYRLSTLKEVAWLDVDLMFSPHKITVIEWADRFGGLLPDEHMQIRLKHVSKNRRRIAVISTASRKKAVIEQLQADLSPAEKEEETPDDVAGD